MRVVECTCMSYEFIDTLLFSLVEHWDMGTQFINEAKAYMKENPPKSEEGRLKALSILAEMEYRLEENGKAQDLLRHMTVCGTDRSFVDEYVDRNPATAERLEEAIAQGEFYPGMERIIKRALEREETDSGNGAHNGDGKGELL